MFGFELSGPKLVSIPNFSSISLQMVDFSRFLAAKSCEVPSLILLQWQQLKIQRTSLIFKLYLKGALIPKGLNKETGHFGIWKPENYMDIAIASPTFKTEHDNTTKYPYRSVHRIFFRRYKASKLHKAGDICTSPLNFG